MTLEEIRELIKQGYHTLDEIKRISRAGMGPCQGKTCAPIIQREIERLTGKKVGEQPLPTTRPPLRGIKLGVLAAAGGDKHED